jgi:hypothetical protein
MNLIEFLNAAKAAGVRLEKRGGNLDMSPAAAVTPELRAAAAEHKQQLLAILPEAPPKKEATPDDYYPFPAATPPPPQPDPSEAEPWQEQEAVQAEANYKRGGLLVEDLVFAVDGLRKEMVRWNETAEQLLKRFDVERFNAVIDRLLERCGAGVVPPPSPKKDPFATEGQP